MRESGVDWHRAAVAYWWVMLALSVAVSSYGNVRHAEGVVPAEYLAEGRWIAGSLPVVLLLLIEGIAIGARAGLAGWQRWMATAFVGALACVVLAASYVGLLSLVEATGLFQVRALSLGLAGVPDLLMIAATVYVMSLRAPASASTATESEETVETEELEQADNETAIATAPVPVVGQPDNAFNDNAVSPLAPMSVVTATEVAPAVRANEVVGAVANGATAAAAVMDNEIANEAVDNAEAQVTADNSGVTGAAVHRPTAVITGLDVGWPRADSPDNADVEDTLDVDNGPAVDNADSAHVAANVADDANEGPADNDAVVPVVRAGEEPVADDAEPLGSVTVGQLAALVVEDTRTKLDVEDVAVVLDRRVAGESYSAIAQAVGVGSHSTVSMLVKAAASLNPDYRAAVNM